MTAVSVGRVLRSIRGHFWVEMDDQVLHASARESLTRQGPRSSVIVIGDLVDITLLDIATHEALIIGVRSRRSQLSRRVTGGGARSSSYEDVVAANIDAAVIVSSTKRPELNTELIDRYLVAAAKGQLEPIICVNKIDLEKEEAARVEGRYRSLGYPVVHTCAKTGEGVDQLIELMRSKTSVLAGHSGVGKSSLMKLLVPGVEVKTAEVSDRSGLGRHTTTTPELVPLPGGGYVIDTPGIRHFTLWQT